MISETIINIDLWFYDNMDLIDSEKKDLSKKKN